MGLSAVRWIALPHVTDPRGTLTSVEGGVDIPFEIRRVFYVHRVSAPERGGHAHRDTQQLLVAVAGSLAVDVCDGRREETHRLDDPDRGLYIPTMVYTRLRDFSPGAVMLVLADTHYDASRSLRSFEDFARAVGAAGGASHG